MNGSGSSERPSEQALEAALDKILKRLGYGGKDYDSIVAKRDCWQILRAALDLVVPQPPTHDNKMDRTMIWYGPHPCDRCGKMIAREQLERGGRKVDYPEGLIYPNTPWPDHVCGVSGAANAQAGTEPEPWCAHCTTPCPECSGTEPRATKKPSDRVKALESALRTLLFAEHGTPAERAACDVAQELLDDRVIYPAPRDGLEAAVQNLTGNDWGGLLVRMPDGAQNEDGTPFDYEAHESDGIEPMRFAAPVERDYSEAATWLTEVLSRSLSAPRGERQAGEGVNAPSSPAGALDASGAASPASLAGDATGQVYHGPLSDDEMPKDREWTEDEWQRNQWWLVGEALKAEHDRAVQLEARHHEAVGLLREALPWVEVGERFTAGNIAIIRSSGGPVPGLHDGIVADHKTLTKLVEDIRRLASALTGEEKKT